MNRPRFEWKSEDGARQLFGFTAPEVTMGRRKDRDVVVSHEHVSRHHAKLVEAPDGYEIVDLDSRYGTFVNGERVDRRKLRHGDTVRLADHDVEFRYLTDAAS